MVKGLSWGVFTHVLPLTLQQPSEKGGQKWDLQWVLVAQTTLDLTKSPCLQAGVHYDSIRRGSSPLLSSYSLTLSLALLPSFLSPPPSHLSSLTRLLEVEASLAPNSQRCSLLSLYLGVDCTQLQICLAAGSVSSPLNLLGEQGKIAGLGALGCHCGREMLANICNPFMEACKVRRETAPFLA